MPIADDAVDHTDQLASPVELTGAFLRARHGRLNAREVPAMLPCEPSGGCLPGPVGLLTPALAP